MPLTDKHAPGSFCWIELATSDQAGAKAFYGALMGWGAQDFPLGPGNFYTMFEHSGHTVAAAYTMRPEQRAQGVAPYWMPYISVEDVDSATRRVSELSGTVLAPAFEVLDAGRMAVVRDPTGAAFSLWQARRHQGFSWVGEHAFCWADLLTPDPTRASEFYGELLDWTTELDP